MDPKNTKDVDRLIDSMLWNRHKMEPFRTKRMQLIEEFAGDNYGDHAAEEPVPINLWQLAATIYQRRLVPNDPAAMVTSTWAQLKPTAKDMEIWMNDRVKQIKLADTLRRSVLDALMLCAVVKVGLCVYDEIEWEGTTHQIGEPFCDLIDFDDLVLDLSAKRWDQMAFIGHRYRIPLGVAQKSELFDPAARAKLQAMALQPYNEQGDERTQTLTTGGYTEPEELEDMTELWEIWLPRDNIVITLPAAEAGTGISKDVLRVVEWNGPRTGPYLLLAFGEVPGQIIPTAPGQHMIHLHKAANKIFNKLLDQADRQKTIIAVHGTATKDGETTLEAKDGEMITSNQPDKIKEIRMGGIDQASFLFFMQVKMLFEYVGGNLGAIGGLGPQSETLGQDQMIQANSSETVKDMQARVLEFARDIMRSLGFYWWTDPVQTYEVERRIPGIEKSFPSYITPVQREGTFYRLNFDINPYSLQAATPSTRLQGVMQFLQQVLMPAGQMLESQGMTIAWEPLIRLMAHLANIPDLEEMIYFSTPPNQTGPYQAPPQRQSTMPATTHRINERISRPGASQQGSDMQMMQALMSSGMGAGRPSGVPQGGQ